MSLDFEMRFIEMDIMASPEHMHGVFLASLKRYWRCVNMCGRYYIDLDDDVSQEIARILANMNKKYTEKNYKTGEIFPTNNVPILIGKDEHIEPELLTWGFPNFKNKGVIINARSETAFEKPTFRNSLVSRRCIVPASGFYEWNKNKEKIAFTQPNSHIMYMAGIYNIYNEESRFVILTTAANISINDVHDRMPLILQGDQLEPWLFDGNHTQNFLNQIPTLLERKSDYEQATFKFD